MATQSDDQSPRWNPTLGQALRLVAFAIVFAVLMWVEHQWRLSRGDYPAPYLKHTWYWYVRSWTAVAFLAGLVVWKLVRWRRR